MKIRTELCVVLIIGVLISLVQVFCLKNFVITQDTIGNLVTFISITFGFFATSLAIFATSKYSGKLYDIEDSSNGGTLLHTLVKKYKIGLFLSLISVVYLLILEVYIGDGTSILFSNWMAAPIIAALCINIFYAFRLIQIVSQFVLQEAKG